MTHDIKSKHAADSEVTTIPFPRSSGSPSVPVKNYPGTHADDSTVKNPKTPETSGTSRVDRAADKAAHKAARDQQDAEKQRPVFTK
jgi:hypothetical protein